VLTSNYKDTQSVGIPSYIDMNNSENIGCSIHKLKSRDKLSAIREIVCNCPVFEFFSDNKCRDKFIEEIFNRESLCTTGIGHNVAIPHGKSTSIDRVRIGLGISPEGLDFGSIDGEPVHLVLVIGSNPANQVEYLKSLAFVMNHLKNPFLRTALINLSLSNSVKNEDPYSRFIKIMKTQDFSS
jgi:nitrogen PTS system EIIA component